jgi:aldehyde dehydrogenase (NAD+)
MCFRAFAQPCRIGRAHVELSRWTGLDPTVLDVPSQGIHDRLFIGGEWIRSSGPPISVLNPATGDWIGSIPASTPSEVAASVHAARSAFDGWSSMPLEERIDHVARLRSELDAVSDEICRTVALDAGMPISLASMLEGSASGMTMNAFMTVASELAWEERMENSLVVREPAGVVAAVTPHTFQISEVVVKITPALLAGCPVVIKPSEVAPLAPLLLAGAADRAGVPPGVVNLVTGGPATGEALVSHAEVDVDSLTGSTEVGRRAAALAAPTLKRLVLELGGKSAGIVALARARGRVEYQFALVGRRDPDHRRLRSAVRAACRDHRQPALADKLDELRPVHDQRVAVSGR